MIGKGIIKEKFQPRASSGKKVMRSCHDKGSCENVVIDVDGDNFDDVIVIDVTESLPKKLCSSNVLRKNRKYPFPSVISIDDDDDFNHTGDGAVAGSGRESDDNACSSKSSPASEPFMSSMGLDGDDCYVINEKRSAFKFSKCRQTYSAKASARNNYGLGPNFESDSSENDCSDCELMEGSFEVLREQWEKASVKKRKRQLFDDESAFDGKSSASGLDNHMNLNVGMGTWRKEHSGNPGTSGSSNRHYQENNMFSHSNIDDNQDNQDCDVGKYNTEPIQNVTGSVKQNFSVDKDTDYQHADQNCREDLPTCSRWKSNDHTDSFSSWLKSKPRIFDYMKVNQEENGTLKPRNYNFTPRPRNYEFSYVPSAQNIFDEGPGNDDADASLSQPTCVLKSRNVADLIGCDGPSFNTPSSGKSVNGRCSDAKFDLNSDISLPDSLCNSTKNNCHETHLAEGKESSEVGDELCTQDSAAASSGHQDIINKREKLKESDEYKQAMEEEWASRQKQLLLQQEEAQRLRKKKKAESLRLLDMERRQKQRVEEVRETQKKDQENMNLKEQIRAEIRREMSKLELISTNMVSLLRGLGIQVGGDCNPSSHEVHAAYKRALLKFHPDRASQTDIRQQVEAEEKFKLISRMKEKFLSTSCY